MSMSLKERISSPLEAGTSILDAHHLPPHVLPALEYASERLSRKAVHLSLVVVRSEYQLPSVPSPLLSSSSGVQTPSTPSTPGTPRLNFAALRQLVRSSSTSSTKSLRLDTQRQRNNATPSSPRVWPRTPMTPMSPPPLTPCTPASSISSMTSGTTASGDGQMPAASQSWGLRFVHPPGLPLRERKMVTATLEKAMQKFDIGRAWLPAPMSPAACGLTDQLIHRSILQNDVLFSSEGLTLVSLDSLYSLKSALSAYSKTKSPLRLEDAVDELRRLVLATNGRKVTKPELLRSYDWLSVSHAAIVDLDRMYKRAYGGPDQVGAIAGMIGSKRHRPVLEPFIRPDDDSRRDQEDVQEEAESSGREDIGLALTTPSKPLTPRAAPILKLQTNFEPPKNADEDGERTARPADHLPLILQSWPVSSIGQVLSATALSPSESRSSQMRLGPKTPNGYEDISPITRGEWGFLTTDNVFRSNKTAAVETFS